MNPRVAHKLLSVLAELEETGKGLPEDIKSKAAELEGAVTACLHGESKPDGEYGESQSQKDGEGSSDFESAKEKTKERFAKSRSQDDSNQS